MKTVSKSATEQAKNAFFPQTTPLEPAKAEEGIPGQEPGGTLKAPVLSQENLEGNKAFDNLNEEEKKQVVDEVNARQEEFAKKGTPMDLETVLTNGVRRAVDIVSSKNKTLEKQLQEYQEKMKELESKSSLDDPEVKKLMEQTEEYKSMKEGFEAIGFEPKVAQEILSGMLKDPKSFRSTLKAKVDPETYKNLFVFEGSAGQIEKSDADRFAESGLIRSMDEFSSEEEYLNEAKEFAKSFRKAFGISNVDEMATDIKAEVNKQVSELMTNNFSSLKAEIMEKLGRTETTPTEVKKEVTQETPKEEAPKEDKPQVPSYADQLTNHAARLVDKHQLSEDEINKVTELLKVDQEYLESTNNGADVITASSKITETILQIVGQRNSIPKQQTTVMSSPSPIAKSTEEAKTFSWNSAVGTILKNKGSTRL